MLGSGLEAGTHVRAFAAVRPIEAITVFSPTPARRKALATRVADELHVASRAADTAEVAVRGATVVLAAARSRGEQPILHGDWLSLGAIVVSIGSTVPEQREIDVSVVARSDLIVCDTVEEVAHETGDMIEVARAGITFEDKIVSPSALLRGEGVERLAYAVQPLFKSVGGGLQDVEAEAQLFSHLILPLLDEAPRRHDEVAFEIATDKKLLDEESSASRKRSGWRGNISP